MGYPSDLTDKEWVLIEHHFVAGSYGKRRKHPIKILINAVFYLTKTGCQWRQLPENFPPWPTVHSFYHRAKKRGLWEKILRDLVSKSRKAMGRNGSPSYSLIDSQSVKTTGKGEARGIDGGKKNKRS
jgi:putative transposase